MSAISDGILQRWFSPPYRQDNHADFKGYRNMLERTPVAGYVGTCHALRDADFTTTTPHLQVPTLCVVGRDDGSTPPALVRQLADLIAGAHYHIIDGAGHLPCIEQPDALYALMHPFLQRVFKS